MIRKATLSAALSPPLAALALCALSACASAPKPAAAAIPVAAPAPRPAEPGIPDHELGLSKGSVFDVTEPKPFEFSKESPGGNDRLPGAFAAAPPRIPHDIRSYLPITIARNGCLKCHDIEKASTPEDATPIPASHHVDLRNAPGVRQQAIAGARWVCTACHVPQAAVAPPIGNGF